MDCCSCRREIQALTFVDVRLGRRLPETFQWNIVALLNGHIEFSRIHRLVGLRLDGFAILKHRFVVLVVVVVFEEIVEDAPLVVLVLGLRCACPTGAGFGCRVPGCIRHVLERLGVELGPLGAAGAARNRRLRPAATLRNLREESRLVCGF